MTHPNENFPSNFPSDLVEGFDTSNQPREMDIFAGWGIVASLLSRGIFTATIWFVGATEDDEGTNNSTEYQGRLANKVLLLKVCVYKMGDNRGTIHKMNYQGHSRGLRASTEEG
ncbi:hypothetical protein J1N35_010886 [Gossypium stocksii]|uniref:Uncharacterized protein n=1 Tax=Gossypium stocksii TaxID=47602 RepID=A0A9D3W356_9ROSI|nr:hypothetical protein J1N35_010886 [Gossypium stocksii]